MGKKCFNYEDRERAKATCIQDLFISTALLNAPSVYVICKIKNDAKGRRLNEETGLNVVGCTVRLKSEYLRHLYERHYNETQKKQRGIHLKDLLSLKDIVLDYDEIIYDEKRKGIKFIKKFPSGTVIFVTVCDEKNRMLEGKSLWVKV